MVTVYGHLIIRTLLYLTLNSVIIQYNLKMNLEAEYAIHWQVVYCGVKHGKYRARHFGYTKDKTNRCLSHGKILMIMEPFRHGSSVFGYMGNSLRLVLDAPQ